MVTIIEYSLYVTQFFHAGGDLHVGNINHAENFKLPVLGFEATFYA